MLKNNLQNLFASALVAGLTFSSLPPVEAAKNNKYHAIDLPTCEVNITADNSEERANVTTYTGNVTILIGFASLKTEKAAIIKKKDGKCQLIPDFK